MAKKILIGGSPCTYWSIAQKNNRETEASGMGWELFKNYLIAKEKFKPDFFLYENNKSAAQAIKDQIAKELGVGVDPDVRFTYINSALVSAQHRQRFYVTNFGDIEQPEDRGILLRDILETGQSDRDKARCDTASVGRTTHREYLQKQQNTMAYEPVMIPPCDPRGRDKSRTITAGYQNCSERDLRADIETGGYLGKQGAIEAVRVGCMPSPDGTIKNSQAKRIYSIDGKSVNLVANGGGEGAKTGLYAIPLNITSEGKSQTIKAQYQQTSPANILGYSSTYGASGVAEPVGFATPIEWDENGIPTKAISCADGKTYTVYEVKDGHITIRGKQYDIKLPDGFYIIRKLTVRECARLQTMPDDYCKSLSDSQAYKALGNGWTAEVIIHLLNHALKDVPRDEEIIVLSLYDGIATGRYCLEQMGFTNVKYHAYEIDKYPITAAMDNYPDIIQHGDAFAVREDDWKAPQTRSEWLDELLGA